MEKKTKEKDPTDPTKRMMRQAGQPPKPAASNSSQVGQAPGGEALKMKTFDLGWDGTFSEKVPDPTAAHVPQGFRESPCGQFLIDANGEWIPNSAKPPSRAGSRGHAAEMPAHGTATMQTLGVTGGITGLDQGLIRCNKVVKHGRRSSSQASSR